MVIFQPDAIPSTIESHFSKWNMANVHLSSLRLVIKCGKFLINDYFM